MNGKGVDGGGSYSGNNNGGEKSGGSSSGGNHACAVCRHQRRKCVPNCLLGTYFPPDKTEEFNNVLRHFGVSNVMKILNSMDPRLHPQAMETIQYEANMRRVDPVNGCLGIARGLMKQIEDVKKELNMVNEQIYYYRQRDQQIQQQQQQPQQLYNMFEPSPMIPPFGGYYYPQPSPPVNPETDEGYNIGQMRNLNLESTYCPTSQEYEDMKPFNRVPPDAYHHKGVFDDAEESSAESAIREPQLLDRFTDNRMKNVVGESSLTDTNCRKGKYIDDN